MFSLALATHPPAQARLDQLEAAMGRNLDAFTGGAAITVAQRMAPKPAATPLAPSGAQPATTGAPARKAAPPAPPKKKAS
jgi:hypothetical protein